MVSAVSIGGQGDVAGIGGGALCDSGDVSITGGSGMARNYAGRAIGAFIDKSKGNTWPEGTTYTW